MMTAECTSEMLAASAETQHVKAAQTAITVLYSVLPGCH
jgi:hypothetical protein